MSALDPSYHAIIVAAGRGERSGAGMPKQFQLLAGVPVLRWSAQVFHHDPRCATLTIVAGADEDGVARTQSAIGAIPAQIVPGGSTRQQSVIAGLAALPDDDLLVFIHDAARPGLAREVIDRLLEALADPANAGAVPMLPVADTLAKDAGALGAVTPRDGLVQVQTPQAFRRKAIMAAHRAPTAIDATDDAQLVRALGGRVATVRGSQRLHKITWPEDFAHVERIMTSREHRMAVGSGYDVHRLVPGDGLWLGGVWISHDRTLDGHSDADVLLHALTDAILGGLADGDIGSHFPPSDAQWRGASSDRFLRHAADLVGVRCGTIEHLDCTVICEAPKIGPHRQAMRQRIADITGLDLGRVSVKATTTERLGFTGRREGIAAQATATLRLVQDNEDNG